MTEPKPLLSGLSEDLRGVAKDAIHLLQLKQQLAQQEVRHDLRAARRLAIVGGLGLVGCLTGLPLLLTAVALLLDGWLGFNAAQWALIFAIPLILGGAGIAWTGWRRFRGELLAFRESIEELQEDLQWLRDWLQ